MISQLDYWRAEAAHHEARASRLEAELARLREHMSMMQQHAAPPAQPAMSQKDKEQSAFEDWLISECPSGDVDAVQRQWEKSSEYLDLQDASSAQPAEPAQRLTDERAAFEAWIRKDGGDLSTFGHVPDMHYRNSAVNNAWTGWQARAIESAIVPPGYVVVPKEPS